jgi:hypothetical protein
MVGGFNFDITMDQVKTHILSKYSKSLGIAYNSQLELTLMGYGVVEISKDAFFAKDFSFEQVVAVRCVIKTGDAETPERVYYAIVRCATYENPRSCLDGKGIWDTVLFVKKGEVIKMDYEQEKQLNNPVIKKIKNYTISGNVSEFFTDHEWFKFENSISSTAKYDIFIEKTTSSDTLKQFFDFLSPTNISMAAYQPDITFEKMKAQIDAQAISYKELLTKREAEDNARPTAAPSNTASGANKASGALHFFPL